MKIAGIYSFNSGVEYINDKYPHLVKEVENAISLVDPSICKTKVSKEKTMLGKILYSPPEINKQFKKYLFEQSWEPKKVLCNYHTEYYTKGYNPEKRIKGAYREIDFLKEKLGVEVQFGKYAFMVYNVCAKMTIFNNLNHIDAGIEIVPIKGFADHMSTGVSSFEQFVWDLEQRGVSDIDIPVIILGINTD